eukprot:CAMPEP_0198275504 /NCGR_PEP_ID=MMETSP1447-20131203/64802_1 /TAXON_ID=420782 /ORGANISM="Chaetoceros dichaeta, Strain CCMP1751" /LENGTH=174 /DNA_ID=CAMNT_0043970371 /DNA_START=20 /DNA_END=544 /DNA_ORIENTATION=+
MNSSDDDSQPDDPIVAFRTPQNRVGVRTRHMAFTAESIRIVREMETMIGMESDNMEEMKSLLLLQLLQMEFDDETSLGLSSNSTSDEESMTITSDENSDGETNTNSSYSITMTSCPTDECFAGSSEMISFLRTLLVLVTEAFTVMMVLLIIGIAFFGDATAVVSPLFKLLSTSS